MSINGTNTVGPAVTYTGANWNMNDNSHSVYMSAADINGG